MSINLKSNLHNLVKENPDNIKKLHIFLKKRNDPFRNKLKEEKLIEIKYNISKKEETSSYLQLLSLINNPEIKEKEIVKIKLYLHGKEIKKDPKGKIEILGHKLNLEPKKRNSVVIIDKNSIEEINYGCKTSNWENKFYNFRRNKKPTKRTINFILPSSWSHFSS